MLIRFFSCPERTPGPLVRPDPEVEPVATQEPSIVLAIIALWAKYSDLPLDETFDRSVFVGIKAYEREGEHVLGEPKWLWSASEVVAFSKRQEFWDVTLPPLSTLLDLPEVSARDAFSIRVVVKHASQPGLPPMVHADQQYISRRVTRQAAAFLDSIRTGDVQFVCLEHAGTGTPDEDGPRKMVRRRVVYAHSELLVHSDYFKATLSGGFAEGSQAPVTTLLVEDAAFNTVYWVLRWLYTDEILFSNVDSVRTVMAQVRVDTAIARRVLQLESWEYASLIPEEEVDDADIRTVRSTSSVGTAASGRLSPGARSAASVASTSSPRRGPAPPIPSSSSSSTSTPRPPRPKSSSPTSATQPRLSRPPAAVPRIATTPASGSTAAAAGRKMGPQTSPVAAGGSGASAPTSPPCARNFIPRRSHAPPPDPHKHPTKPPAPPSPLAVFFLAHRYGLEDLQVLARDALLRNLTPDTCIAALLATYAFGDLHAAVMDYVVSGMEWKESGLKAHIITERPLGRGVCVARARQVLPGSLGGSVGRAARRAGPAGPHAPSDRHVHLRGARAGLGSGGGAACINKCESEIPCSFTASSFFIFDV